MWGWSKNRYVNQLINAFSVNVDARESQISSSAFGSDLNPDDRKAVQAYWKGYIDGQREFLKVLHKEARGGR